ncbi:MAG: hypothetical protein HYT11_04610 [Candidatus Levybacteria bacterium]|nr:hypothetical protein [Candidatus Levybacteria bacterium]
MKRFLPIFIFVIFGSIFVLSPSITLANHRQSVLGDSTASSELVFPPLSSGPGFFLPNSPLYFLDKWFQIVRLTLAFSPERSAVIRSQIAGERLAELRVMLAQNDVSGINTALSELTKEAGETANSLNQASAQGRNVQDLARQLNETVKTQRKTLGILASQARGTLKLQLKTARKSLQEAKIEIEDELPENEIENEIENELEEDINDAVDETQDISKGLEHAIDVLNKLASEAAVRNQQRRLEALTHAIEVKSDAFHKQQEILLNEQENAARNAHSALKDAQKALDRLSEAAKEAREIKAQSESDESGSNSGSGGGHSGND